jgi:type VI secretion system protein VasI
MKALSYFILAVALALPSGLLAETKRTLENCHAMSTGYIRLMCYDEVSGFKAEKEEQVSEAAETEQISKPSGNQWRVSTEKSALTGRTDVFMSISSENRESNNIGTPEAGRLWIRCMDNTTALLITHGIYVSDAHNVRYKLDDGPIQKKWMNTLNGGDGVGLFSGSASIPFIKSMFGKDKMVAVISGYSRKVELVFDISGLRERIDELATSCEWTP